MNKVLCQVVCAGLMCGALMQTGLSSAQSKGGGGKSDATTSVRIALTGAAITSVKPEGHADFRTRGTQRRLTVEVERVNLPDSMIVSALVNGNVVGMIKLIARRGQLELNSKNGAAVPAVQKGDIVTVTTSTGDTILSGTF